MPAVTTDVPNLFGSGAILIPIPVIPGFRSMEWTLSTPSTVNTSPFTGQAQAQAWVGAEAWRVKATLPPMQPSTAAQWRAFLLRLRGRVNAFQLGDQLNWIPGGNAGGSSPTSVGNNLPGQIMLNTSGWQANTFGVTAVGDYLQIGYRLYQCLVSADADGNGNATFEVWPSLREAHPANTPVQLVQPVGVFRLIEDSVKWTHDYERLPQLSFEGIEFR